MKININIFCGNFAQRAGLFSSAMAITFFSIGPLAAFGSAPSGSGNQYQYHHNNDGILDYLWISPGTDNQPGIVTSYDGNDGTILFQTESPELEDYYGRVALPYGDLDGDFVADIIVSAPGSWSTAGQGGLGLHSQCGRVTMYSGASGNVLWTREGPTHMGGFGFTVTTIDDVNNDGYKDLAVSEIAKSYVEQTSNPFAPIVRPFAGRVSVISGLTGYTLGVMEGDETGQFFGWDTKCVPDIDGDGIRDLAISSPFGLVEASAGTPGKVEIVSPVNGEILAVFTNNQPDDLFGFSIDYAGDLDGNGEADLAIGAPMAYSGTGDAGRVFFAGLGSNSLVEKYSNGVVDTFGSHVSIMPTDVTGGNPELLVVSADSVNAYNSVSRIIDTVTDAILEETVLSDDMALPVDLNNDGVVDSADLDLVIADFGVTNTFGLITDQNFDNKVDIQDANIIIGSYGQTDLSQSEAYWALQQGGALQLEGLAVSRALSPGCRRAIHRAGHWPWYYLGGCAFLGLLVGAFATPAAGWVVFMWCGGRGGLAFVTALFLNALFTCP